MTSTISKCPYCSSIDTVLEELEVPNSLGLSCYLERVTCEHCGLSSPGFEINMFLPDESSHKAILYWNQMTQRMGPIWNGECWNE